MSTAFPSGSQHPLDFPQNVEIVDLFDEAQQAKALAKSQNEAQFRAKRKARCKALVELHHEVVAAENAKSPKIRISRNAVFSVGFKAYRILRNREVELLPCEFGPILKSCEELVENKKRFPALYAWCDEINNRQCRELVARVLATILANTDFVGGRIGDPSQSGIKTISWHQIQEDHALRFGRYLSPKSCSKAVTLLRKAGYLHTESIRVNVDSLEREVRSAAGYKQFTERFFSDLKVVRYSNIAKSILATRKRNEQKGFKYAWLEFREIAAQVQERYIAAKLNKYADMTAQVFCSYKEESAPLLQ